MLKSIVSTPGEKFKKIILDNPDLPVLFFATDEANSGEYYSELADARVEIGMVLDYEGPCNDRIYFDEDDLEEDIRELLTDEDWSDEEYEAEVAKRLEEYFQYWRKCIVVTVDRC